MAAISPALRTGQARRKYLTSSDMLVLGTAKDGIGFLQALKEATSRLTVAGSGLRIEFLASTWHWPCVDNWQYFIVLRWIWPKVQ